jgi:hypothetical protein
MNKTELRMALEQVQPGMVLARSVLDQQGHFLLPESVELNTGAIETLKRHEVTEIWVHAPGLGSDDSAKFPFRQLRLERLFRCIGESEDDQFLFNLMTRYRAAESS